MTGSSPSSRRARATEEAASSTAAVGAEVSSQATSSAVSAHQHQHHHQHHHPTSTDGSVGAPSPSFASTSSTGPSELRYYSYPSQGCCADCATWSSHGTLTTRTHHTLLTVATTERAISFPFFSSALGTKRSLMRIVVFTRLGRNSIFFTEGVKVAFHDRVRLLDSRPGSAQSTIKRRLKLTITQGCETICP